MFLFSRNLAMPFSI